MSELDNSALFDGPFTVFPKGVEPVTFWNRKAGHFESSCAYCASIITGNRCESCGAPRRAEKPKPQEWPMLLHDSGPVRDGDVWRRTRIELHPPLNAYTLK